MNETAAPQKPKNNGLMLRVLSALVMLPAAIFIILYGGVLYFLFVTLMTALILYEWNGICEERPSKIAFLFQFLFVLAVIYQVWFRDNLAIYCYIVPLFLMIVVYIKRGMKLHFALLGIIYALLPAVSLLWIRRWQTEGEWIVLWMMIIVWSMDTGAYFAGKNIGGPKLAPRISPNKTWAGLIGGAVTAVIFGLISAYFMNFENLDHGMSMMMLALFAAILAIWSQVGDLAESALKRHFKVKDSGAIIPGHGGIMDRVDGVVFAAPAVAAFLFLLTWSN